MDLNFDFNDPKPEGPPNTESGEGETTSNAKQVEVVDSTPFDQFDLKKVEGENSFLVIKQKITEMELKATELKIVDDSTFKTAMEMLVQLRALEKMADDFKKNHAVFKRIAQFKNGFDKLIRENIKNVTKKISATLSPKIGFYQKTQAELARKKAAKKAEEDAKAATEEAERLAKEKKENEEADRQDAIDLQAKLNLEADEAGVGRVSVPIPEVSDEPVIPIVPEIPVTQKSEKVITDHGAAKIKSVWVVKITDPDKIGRQFCSPDQKKLDAAIEAGVREIYGCVVEESFDPKIRLSKKKAEVDFKF